MKVPTLYVLRHGQTLWNAEGRLQGHRESDLTALGRVQAARQGAILRRLACRATAFTSPLRRARQSAALAGIPATPDAHLIELGLGAWEGCLQGDLPASSGVLWKFTAPGGESQTSLSARAEAFVAMLRGPTIVFTHGVMGIALRAHILGRPVEEWDRMDDPQGVVHVLENGTETIIG